MKLATNVTIDEFFMIMRETYEHNNYISTVKVEFYDGANRVKMAYITPPGFQQEQRQRKGNIELME